jgi:hypothetical protein
MLDIPMMEPPGGDWVDICVAAAWTLLNAPVRLADMVWFHRSGVMLRCVSFENDPYLMQALRVKHTLESP